MYTKILILFSLIILSSAYVSAYPFPSVSVSQDHYEVLRMRASTDVNPAAVFGTTCIDMNANIASHDQNVAELAICGGIAGPIAKCRGAPSSTSGSSGTAQFVLSPTTRRAKINISKERWEACVRAATAVCASGSFMSTCRGGATSGDISFSLTTP